MKIHHSINISLNYQADECDLAIVSVDRYGTVGRLNQQILKSYEYQMSDLNPRELSKGYAFLKRGEKKGILFIVTVGGGSTSENLNENLYNAINSNLTALENQRVWVPLMGTGDGKLDYKVSYEIIFNVLKKFSERVRFFISIPDSNRGVGLYNEIVSEGTENGNTTEIFLTEFSPNFYLVGSSWGNAGDQTNRFLNNSIWQNGYDEKYNDLVRSVEKGDILVMKSTYAENSLSYLRIKAIGVVSNNPGDGRSLDVDWIGLPFINIEGLGHYRPTILEPNPNHIPGILKRIENVDQEIFEKLSSFLSTYQFQYSNNEIYVDNQKSILVGFEVGNEIKAYDVIFLPKSSHGGVGQNSIATHILRLLGVDTTSIEFSDLDLLENKFKWIYFDTDIKRIDICFVVTRDKNKLAFDFKSNLELAILNFPGFLPAESKPQKTKIFIPLLGAGQANMSISDSFNIINDSLSLFPNTFKEPQIRINFPHEIDKENLLNYINVLSTTYKLQQVDNLNEQIGLLYGIEDQSKIENLGETKDKIPFHLDQVVDEDKLGREPVAKAFVDLIKQDIFTKKLKHSFIVHLQGEWGAGKSSFLNFIKKNLNSEKKKEHWIVVEYNAWQNQHIQPPWWTLIDQIYRKSKPQLNLKSRFKLKIREFFRRTWLYTGWNKVVAFLVFAVAVISIAYFGNDIINVLGNVQEPTGNVSVEEKGFVLGVYGKLFLTLISVIGGIYSFSKFITIPFFINSSSDAESFVKKSSDPMNRVKKHFNGLVDNINFTSENKRRQLAIFIDDIDRCDKDFIVELLEGIQTLFKEKRILYIVAGDKNWITTSFGNIYKEFTSEGVDKNRMGEFFLEKAFQLSFRMPNVSEEGKQAYWDHILGIEDHVEKVKIDSVGALSQEAQIELKSKLSSAKEELTNPTFMKKMEEDYNLSSDTVSNIVIEEKNKDQEEIRHLLKDFHSMIETNPRSIIRLANNYTMTRSTLIAERREVSEQKIFRWLVIEDLCPQVKNKINSSQEVSEIEEILGNIKNTITKDNCFKLLNDLDENWGGPISLEDIRNIKGR